MEVKELRRHDSAAAAPPPHHPDPALTALQRQFDLLYRMHCDLAGRLAALEGEFFLLKRQLADQKQTTTQDA